MFLPMLFACGILVKKITLCMQEWEEGDGNYLAPELLTDSDPTPAADVFSLGATLYQCMTGMQDPSIACLHVCCSITAFQPCVKQ